MGVGADNAATRPHVIDTAAPGGAELAAIPRGKHDIVFAGCLSNNNVERMLRVSTVIKRVVGGARLAAASMLVAEVEGGPCVDQHPRPLPSGIPCLAQTLDIREHFTKRGMSIGQERGNVGYVCWDDG